MKKILYLFISICFINGFVFAQNPEWIVYDTSNSGLPSNVITSIAIDANGIKWIGTGDGGLVKFDGTSWTIFNTSNSDLPSNVVSVIAIDTNNTKWIGTGSAGLVKFDGINWTVYNNSNSGLPYGGVSILAIDTDGNKWIGSGTLTMFDDTNWVEYNSSNSGIIANAVLSIAIDGSGNIWNGECMSDISWEFGGLTMFDNTNWTVYDTSNSGIPQNCVTSVVAGNNGIVWLSTEAYGMARFDGTSWFYYNDSNSFNIRRILIESQGNLWMNMWGSLGLGKFDGSIWNFYNTSNSELPYNNVTSIVIDTYGNKWIGTRNGGLAVFREGGVVSVNNNIDMRNEVILYNNYPNPINQSTIFRFYLSEKSFVNLNIFDLQGKKIITLVKQMIEPGEHSINFNAISLTNGIYFYSLQTNNYIETKKMVIIK